MIPVIHAVLKLSGRYASRIRAAYVFSFLKAMCKNIPLMLAVMTVDRLVQKTATVQWCIVIACVMLMLLFLQALLQNICDRLQSAAGYQVFDEKRLELGRHLRSLPMGYFTSGNLGKISSVLSNDMVFIEENSMHLVADVVNDIFGECIVLAFLFTIHPLTGLTASAFVILAVLLAQFMNAGARRNGDRRQESTEKLSGAVLEYIDGMQAVRGFPARVRAAFADNAMTNLAFEQYLTPWQASLMIVYGAGMAATLAVSVHLYETGVMSMTYLTGVVLFLFHIYAPVMHLYQQGTTLMVMYACLKRILRVFDETPLPDTGTQTLPARSHAGESGGYAANATACGGADRADVETAIPEIAFDRVSFAYDTEDVLHDISFSTQRGETIALVGKSGSGKTTIANLLPRFWDVSKGCVKLRGLDVRTLPLAALMSQISMVFQNVYLFEDTVYNNIAMGRPDATRGDVIAAAKRARCHDFIMRLPYGYDTVLGEGGASLSGGEKQRISIARCILKDAPIVILDEATASVDADNERFIQEALSDLCRNKTTLVIAHRLTTIRGADRILVIDKGRIAEQGNHAELIKKDGMYARMVRAMAQ